MTTTQPNRMLSLIALSNATRIPSDKQKRLNVEDKLITQACDCMLKLVSMYEHDSDLTKAIITLESVISLKSLTKHSISTDVERLERLQSQL